MKLRVVALASALVAARLVRAKIQAKVVSATVDGQPVDPSTLRLEPATGRSPSRQSSRLGRRAKKRSGISYSDAWCGACQHAPRADPFTSVSSSFQAPLLALRPDVPAPQFAAAWVGIDGASCQQALLQAGVASEIVSDGVQGAWAWFEWVPDDTLIIVGLPVSPGDWMAVNVTATSPTSGTVNIQNLSRSRGATVEVGDGHPLCRTDAEWMVEDFFYNDTQVALARFYDVWFTQCKATTAGGGEIGVDGSTMVYLQNGRAPSCTVARTDDGAFRCISS